MKIAVLPGDGVGTEVIAEALKVLAALRRECLAFEMEQDSVGGAAYDTSGDPLPEPTLELARKADAILFGAVGEPRNDALPREKRPEQAILRLRKELGLFANLRPASVFPELADASTLRPEVVAGLDILIVRELTGDIYFGQPRGIRKLEGGMREGFDTMRYTDEEIRRIAHAGFRAARKRKGKLCSVDKANVLERHAAFGFARRKGQGTVRADSWIGAGHRRKEPRQSAGGHPVCRDDASLQLRSGPGRRPRRRRGEECTRSGVSHRGYFSAGNPKSWHPRDGRCRGRSAPLMRCNLFVAQCASIRRSGIREMR